MSYFVICSITSCCVFENNIINGTNRGNGGAIDNSGTMTIVDCIFKNNIATVTNSSGFRKNAADGGAISNLGTAKIYNTTFISTYVNRRSINTRIYALTYQLRLRHLNHIILSSFSSMISDQPISFFSIIGYS